MKVLFIDKRTNRETNQLEVNSEEEAKGLVKEFNDKIDIGIFELRIIKNRS